MPPAVTTISGLVSIVLLDSQLLLATWQYLQTQTLARQNDFVNSPVFNVVRSMKAPIAWLLRNIRENLMPPQVCAFLNKLFKTELLTAISSHNRHLRNSGKLQCHRTHLAHLHNIHCIPWIVFLVNVHRYVRHHSLRCGHGHHVLRPNVKAPSIDCQ